MKADSLDLRKKRGELLEGLDDEAQGYRLSSRRISR